MINKIATAVLWQEIHIALCCNNGMLYEQLFAYMGGEEGVCHNLYVFSDEGVI